MPRRKRSQSPCDFFDDDFDDDSNSSSRNGHPPIQRNAANARERARMRVLSSAFGRLKTKLPNIPPDTKLSKLDTLRLATMYIKQLRALAEGASASSDNAINSMQFTDHASILGMQNGAHNMTWPFGLHHIQHPTNRQLPLGCSTMEWTPQHDVANTNTKNAHLNDDAHYQMNHHTQQFHAWYTNPAQDINCFTARNSHNNFDVFDSYNQASITPQSQHLTNTSISSSTSSSAHHMQGTMSPIR